MKKILIAIILILGLGMGLVVGNIINPKEILKEKNKNWTLYFSNLSTSILNGGVFVPEKPVIESTSLKAYDVIISKPGDFATYTFDIINDGDYDAKLKSLTKLSPKCISLELPANTEDENMVCNNLEYKLYYTNNNKELKINDIIKSKSRENITLKVGYKGDKYLNSNEGVQVTLYDMNFKYDRVI